MSDWGLVAKILEDSDNTAIKRQNNPLDEQAKVMTKWAKGLLDTSPKKIHRGQTSVRKDALHQLSSGTANLNSERETPPHTRENGQNPKHRQHQVLTRTRSSRNARSPVAGGSATRRSHCGRPMSVFLQNETHLYREIQQ